MLPWGHPEWENPSLFIVYKNNSLLMHTIQAFILMKNNIWKNQFFSLPEGPYCSELPTIHLKCLDHHCEKSSKVVSWFTNNSFYDSKWDGHSWLCRKYAHSCVHHLIQSWRMKANFLKVSICKSSLFMNNTVHEVSQYMTLSYLGKEEFGVSQAFTMGATSIQPVEDSIL